MGDIYMPPRTAPRANGSGESASSRYYDEHGCTYGQVNRIRIERLEQDMRGINTKLWALLVILIVQLCSVIVYLATHGAVRA